MRHRRLRRRWIALTLVVILVAGVSGAGLAYYSVKNQANALQAQLTNHLQLGQAALEKGKDSLKQANTTHDVKFVESATADFKQAKVEFSTTRKLADGSKLLGQIESVPVAGPQARSLHAALDHVSDMGDAISDAGIELSALAGQVIVPQKSGQAAGKTLLNVLDLTDKSIGTVRADLKRADTAAGQIDLSVVPAGQQTTLTKARASIAGGLAALDQFQQFVPVIREILGANGPRNYLVEQVNPAELRPGGGFVGSYSLITADQGSLKLIRSGDSYDLANPRPVIGQKGYVAPPGPLQQLVGGTSWSFVDSNFFPDFSENALAAESFAAPKLGMRIDAVISIDYYAVAKLLDLSGPIRIPGYAITVDSTNFITTIMSHSLVQDALNKPILAAVAGPLMQQITNLPSEKWPTVITTLNGLVNEHHLQAYFNNPAAQAQMASFGWSGDLASPRPSDFMMEVEANVGATKANYFITRRYTVVLTRRGNLLHHKVSVDDSNATPYIYKPNDFYRAYIRLLVPSNATGLQSDLKQLRWPNVPAPSGVKQIAGWETMPGQGNGRLFTFEYDTSWPSNSRGVHVLYWQKQPGTLNDAIDITWSDATGRTFKVNSALTQDLLITLSPSGAQVVRAETASARLPALSLG